MAQLRLKAATLLESMVAMVIVLVCFGTGSMIYVNVMNSDHKRVQLHAHLLLNKIAHDTKDQQLFIDESISAEGLAIEKKIEPYKDIGGLIQLVITAADADGKIISTHKEIICTECRNN